MEDRKPIKFISPFLFYFVTAFVLVLAALALFANDIARDNPPSVWQNWPTLAGDLNASAWGISAESNWARALLFATKWAAVGVPVMFAFTGLMHLFNTGKYAPDGAYLQLLRRSWPYMLTLLPLPLLLPLANVIPDAAATRIYEQAMAFIIIGAVAIFAIFYPEIIARAYLVSLDRARWSSLPLLVACLLVMLFVWIILPVLLAIPSLSL